MVSGCFFFQNPLVCVNAIKFKGVPIIGPVTACFLSGTRALGLMVLKQHIALVQKPGNPDVHGSSLNHSIKNHLGSTEGTESDHHPAAADPVIDDLMSV